MPKYVKEIDSENNKIFKNVVNRLFETGHHNSAFW